jgi:DNA-binding CsgD family transcriptional regulator
MRLSEANTALRVLTQSLQTEKENMQENFLVNIKRNVEPYFEKLKNTNLNQRQRTLMHTVENHMREIASTFTYRLESKHTGLTAQEIRIAELIRLGNTSKDISNILNISPNTVDTHRRNIRKKLGFNRSSENLRTKLLMIN